MTHPMELEAERRGERLNPATEDGPPLTCRYRAAHSTRPASAEVRFHEGGDPGRETSWMPVCASCADAVLRWMRAGTVNAAGQYPTGHYPLTRR